MELFSINVMETVANVIFAIVSVGAAGVIGYITYDIVKFCRQ